MPRIIYNRPAPADENPDGTPARRRQPRIPIAAAVAAALVVGLVGYAAGQSRRGSSSDTASPCAAATAALQRQGAEVSKAVPGDTSALRTEMNLVVANGGCFDPQVVAVAQTALDKLDQNDAAWIASQCSGRGFPFC